MDSRDFFVLLIVVWAARWWRSGRKHYRLVEVDIQLGGVGKVKLTPTVDDINVAHKIWTELVTRKAALHIDPEHDVIFEVYDSWFAHFTTVRELIRELPADLVRSEDSTRKIIHIATRTLNDGLRPHLTHWQARFSNWYTKQDELLKTKSPQEVQKTYPEYDALIRDMKEVNNQMITYATELKKIIQG